MPTVPDEYVPLLVLVPLVIVEMEMLAPHLEGDVEGAELDEMDLAVFFVRHDVSTEIMPCFGVGLKSQ